MKNNQMNSNVLKIFYKFEKETLNLFIFQMIGESIIIAFLIFIILYFATTKIILTAIVSLIIILLIYFMFIIMNFSNILTIIKYKKGFIIGFSKLNPQYEFFKIYRLLNGISILFLTEPLNLENSFIFQFDSMRFSVGIPIIKNINGIENEFTEIIEKKIDKYNLRIQSDNLKFIMRKIHHPTEKSKIWCVMFEADILDNPKIIFGGNPDLNDTNFALQTLNNILNKKEKL
jgi:uncharacterized membrane protein YcgQ (UPF0703/DUF1980 family)